MSAEPSVVCAPPDGIGRLYRKATENFADLRRSKLTQLDFLSAAPPLSSLHTLRILAAAVVTVLYSYSILPRIRAFGSAHWQAEVGAHRAEARPGGPFSEVHFSYAVLLSLVYVSFTFLGVNRMAQRPLPVQAFIFESAAVHNATQCLFNIYCLWGLLREGWDRGLQIWGNPWDVSEQGHALGGLLWLQYHCRQLQLFETAFMVLQKKFHGISFAHLYLRVLNLWGWFIACRFVCGGEAYFPAVVSALCQALVYAVYVSLSLRQRIPTLKHAVGTPSSAALPRPAGGKASRATWVIRLQIVQYIICAAHSVAAALWGNFPWCLAVLHIFVIGNGLVLYTDFHSQGEDRPPDSPSKREKRRVTFSFDSCGWLMAYHFGVGAWLSEHMGLEAAPTAPEGIAFSGSSGGSLISCVLGAGIRVRDVFDYVLEQYPECRKNPTRMFPAVERALRKFQYEGANKRLSQCLRILLTRVSWRPPFIMGEVASSFPDLETAVQVLCASCHIPLAAGILPRCVGGRYYYDGAMWPSRMLVPWRGAEGDHVVRITACGAPMADICIPRVPLWWGLFPPPPEVLRGIYWCGYRDAANWIRKEPSSSFDPCRCRRQPRHGKDPTEGPTPASPADLPGDHERWQAVRALLKSEDSFNLPEVDPVTGENVQELIALAGKLADRESRAAQGVLTALLVGGASLLLATWVPALAALG